MKTIIVPTDFSNNAYNALYYATRLFKDETVRFLLLNSFEEENTMSTSRIDIGKSEVIIEELFHKSYTELAEVKHSIVRDTEGMDHTFETIPTSKKLVREINFLIKKREIDMIIMGTKGATGAKGVILGSNTVRVLKKIKESPILVVPEMSDYKKPKHIAFATDLNQVYAEHHLKPIIRMALDNDATVHVLHVMEEETITVKRKDHYNELAEKMKDVKKEMHWLPLDWSKTETIMKFVEQDKIDMLAMIYYKHGFLKKMFRESVIKKIGRQPQTPYLVIPAR